MRKNSASFEEENRLWKDGFALVAGVDEVGRGAWAGPVVAAAVIFPRKIAFPDELYDSKLILPRQRERLTKLVYQYAVSVGLGVVGVKTINKFGIGKATQKAFRKAVRALTIDPEKILIDAFYIKYLDKKNQIPLKKGDQICATIAAASIVAKVYRDSIMRKLSRIYPVYGFGVHKGYGTAYHQKVIRKNNLCAIHRKSFDLSYLIQ